MRAPRGRRGLAVIALALIATGTTAGAAQAGGGRPAAQVDISPFAKEFQRGAMLVHLSARCDAGNIVQELIIEYSQNGFTISQPAAIDFVCDGRWHRFDEIGPEAFEPGPADVAARLTIIDEVTGDPLPQAVDWQRVWVEPAAKVKFGNARLAEDGSIVLTTWARCDQPWVVQELYVEVAQGTASGSAVRTDEFIPCDDRWHRVVLPIASVGTPFQRGPADASAYLTVLDPLSFDPVAQAQQFVSVRIRG